MESEHILFEIPCGLCYFTQFEHKLGTLLLGRMGWVYRSNRPLAPQGSTSPLDDTGSPISSAATVP